MTEFEKSIAGLSHPAVLETIRQVSENAPAPYRSFILHTLFPHIEALTRHVPDEVRNYFGSNYERPTTQE